MLRHCFIILSKRCYWNGNRSKQEMCLWEAVRTQGEPIHLECRVLRSMEESVDTTTWIQRGMTNTHSHAGGTGRMEVLVSQWASLRWWRFECTHGSGWQCVWMANWPFSGAHRTALLTLRSLEELLLRHRVLWQPGVYTVRGVLNGFPSRVPAEKRSWPTHKTFPVRQKRMPRAFAYREWVAWNRGLVG